MILSSSSWANGCGATNERLLGFTVPRCSPAPAVSAHAQPWTNLYCKGGSLSDPEHNECLRKLRHPHFLSALQHAIQLSEEGISIYKCHWCGWLHLGHSRVSVSVSIPSLAAAAMSSDPITRAILRTERKIAQRKALYRTARETDPEQLRRIKQSLTSLWAHLAMLRQHLKAQKQETSTHASTP